MLNKIYPPRECPEFQVLRQSWVSFLPDYIRQRLTEKEFGTKKNAPLYVFLPGNPKKAWIRGPVQSGYNYILSEDAEKEIIHLFEGYADALNLIIHDMNSYADKAREKLASKHE